MTEGERVKAVRKSEKVNLTLEKFGGRLGVKKSTMSNIESGRYDITEQMRKSICREFNVSYVWLTEGFGDMFYETDDDVVSDVDHIMKGESDFHKNLIKTAACLDKEDLLALERILQKFVKISQEKD